MATRELLYEYRRDAGAPESHPSALSQIPYGYKYKMPLFEVDTRLVAFDSEFHVNSGKLKQHSLFFREKLNGPESEASMSSKFKYEYRMGITPGQGNYVWYLEGKSETCKFWQDPKGASKPHPISAEWIASVQALTFTNLLSAMYGYPWQIKDAIEFEHLVLLAKLLGSLPVLSSALQYALDRSPEFIENIPSTADQLLISARILRHKVLFKECFVHVVGRAYATSSAEKPQFGFDLHGRDVGTLIYKQCSRISAMRQEIDAILAQIIGLATPGTQYATFLEKFIGPRKSRPSGMVEFYGELWLFILLRTPTTQALDVRLQALGARLKQLMARNLVLDKSYKTSGRGYPYHLCATITDEELPWDIQEMEVKKERNTMGHLDQRKWINYTQQDFEAEAQPNEDSAEMEVDSVPPKEAKKESHVLKSLLGKENSPERQYGTNDCCTRTTKKYCYGNSRPAG